MLDYHDSIVNISKNGLKKLALQKDCITFIGWLSFDERSLTAIRSLDLSNIASIRFLTFGLNRESTALNKISLERTVSTHPDFKFVELDRENQISGFKRLKQELTKLTRHGNYLYIDISAFPREYVCLLAQAVYLGRLGKRTSLVYNIADDYSYLQKRKSAKWLSRGIGPVQPIYGFSGKTFPGRPVAMVALTGFDNDRLVGVAERVDPFWLVLGKPFNLDKSREWISKRIDKSASELQWTCANLRSFDFDCDKIDETRNKILRLSNELCENHNVVVAPNNNKISTYACAQAAMSDARIQLIFAPAIVYNFQGYSRPSPRFLVTVDVA
jgi:hypothetical protein